MSHSLGHEEGRVRVRDDAAARLHDHDAVARLFQRGGELLALVADPIALRDIAPDREEPIAEPGDLDVHQAAPRASVGARDGELDAVVGPAVPGCDELAERVEETHAAQVEQLMHGLRADRRFGRAAHEGRSRAVREDDPEVDGRPGRVALGRADDERVAHRVERAAHGGLGRLELCLEPDLLARRRALRERAPHGGDKRLEPALEDVVGRAAVERLDHQVLAHGARDQDHGDGGIRGVGRRDGRLAGEAGQPPVGEDDLGDERGQRGQELGLGRHHPGVDLETRLPQGAHDQLGVVGVVLDEQDPQGRRQGLGHVGTSLRSSQ